MSHKLHDEDLKWSHGPSWEGHRKQFFIATTAATTALLITILAALSFLSGTEYGSTQKVHHLHVLAVDYDGGVIGQALQVAYESLEGDTFPTVEFHTRSEYPSAAELEHAVYKGDKGIWAAIYALEGASERLTAALQGGQAASAYRDSDAIRYIWNSARYPTVAQSRIEANLDKLILSVRAAYYQVNESYAHSNLNESDSAAVSTLLEPITSSSYDIKPTPADTRVFYNTANIAVNTILMFFLVVTLNGVSLKFSLFTRLTARTNGTIRDLYCLTATFMSSLVWTGYVWAFKDDWALNGGQFMLVWMDGWLYQLVSIKFFDIVMAYTPMPAAPFVAISWVILNVSCAVVTIPLAPALYKVAYAIPSLNYYEVFITIVSGGACDRLYRNLPVLFSWLLVMQVLGVFATAHRCHAAKDSERKEQQLTDGLAAAEARKAADGRSMTEVQLENGLAREELRRSAYYPAA